MEKAGFVPAFSFGARSRTRTGTPLRTMDFKSMASAIPPCEPLYKPNLDEDPFEGLMLVVGISWLGRLERCKIPTRCYAT